MNMYMVQTRKKNNNKKTRQRRKRRTNRGGMQKLASSLAPTARSAFLLSTARYALPPMTTALLNPLMARPTLTSMPRSAIYSLKNLVDSNTLNKRIPYIDQNIYEQIKNKNLEIEKIENNDPPSIPKTEEELLESLEEKIKRELEPIFPDIESIHLNNITAANIDKHHKLNMKNIASIAIRGIEKQILVDYKTFPGPNGYYEPTEITFNTLDAKVALRAREVKKIQILCQQVRVRIHHGESIHSAVMWGMSEAKDYKIIYNTLQFYLIMIMALIATLKELIDNVCKTDSKLYNKDNCKLITRLKNTLEIAIQNPENIADPTFISLGDLHTILSEVIKSEYEDMLYHIWFPTSS